MPCQSSSFTPTSNTTQALRRAFGCFGTGVTIVTTSTDTGPLGMTANSFSSISLEPALVLWSPAKSSLRHNAFVEASHFCIHVLSDDQLEMAQHFARHGTDFSPYAHGEGPMGAPRLDGCLAEFHCDTHAVYPAGDHTIVVGEVRQVFQHPSDRSGLIFARGQFGSFLSQDDASQ